MTEQEKREKIIKGLECCQLDVNKCLDCPYLDKQNKVAECGIELHRDALALLKAQEQGVATVEPKHIELADGTKAWLDKMDAVGVLNIIAGICIDWDGYRTAVGLGGLIDEIRAYARYCADRLLKAQEPRTVHVTAEINYRKIGECPNCGKLINSGDYPHYCGRCGQEVKWE